LKAKSVFVAVSVLLFGTFSVAGAADDPAEVKALVIQFANAYRAGNTQVIDRLLASQYSHINNGGKPIDREAYLDWNRKRKAKLTSGAWSIASYDLSELKVTAFQESAVATGVVTASGERDGKGWNSKVRFTNLWIRENGAWRRAAFHDTKLDEGRE